VPRDSRHPREARPLAETRRCSACRQGFLQRHGVRFLTRQGAKLLHGECDRGEPRCQFAASVVGVVRANATTQ
jgi:hypothetical protein